MSRLPSKRVGLWVVVGSLIASGCGTPKNATTAPALPFRGESIIVAAIGDARLATSIAAQRGEWEASREASCRVLDKAVEPTDTAGAHVLIFRADRLGDLVDAGLLAVLPEAIVQPPAAADPDPDRPGHESAADSTSEPTDPLQFSDVIPAFRDQVSKYGNDRLGLPYGGSALVLVYNRSAFQRDENLTAAKTSGLTIEPPKTWTDLDRLAAFFQGRDWDGDGSVDSGIALALGPDPDGVGDATFLARASALGLHRDHYSLLFDSDSMEPRVASPPFVEALGALVALKASGPAGMEHFDIPKAREAFREGRAALLIDRADAVSAWGGGKVKGIGVAPLPGSDRVFEPINKTWEVSSTPNRPSYLPRGGGWLVAVAESARGRPRDAAIDLIKYLTNPETSHRVLADHDLPMLPVRGSQVAQGIPDPRSAPGVDARAWSEAVSKTLLAPRVVPGLRIPEADAYLADLARGRVAAATGEPVDAALQGVAQAWSTRTKALGRSRQLWHYRRSLNRLVTTPKPPPRD